MRKRLTSGYLPPLVVRRVRGFCTFFDNARIPDEGFQFTTIAGFVGQVENLHTDFYMAILRDGRQILLRG